MTLLSTVGLAGRERRDDEEGGGLSLGIVEYAFKGKWDQGPLENGSSGRVRYIDASSETGKSEALTCYDSGRSCLPSFFLSLRPSWILAIKKIPHDIM